ncbi:MAG: hypothetical protein M1840_008191 [Geoglossum simile]|nr:MAG: hypothetical protein M1840_008191 [Geoglossum simile]
MPQSEGETMGLISKEEGPGFTAECQPVFPLQRLPPELRNEIYRYVLVFPGPVRPVRPNESLSVRRYHRAVYLHEAVGLSSIVVPDPNPPPTCLALLAADKATYKEAMPIFYAENHFEFDKCIRLTSFLSGISPARQSWLRRLTINVYATTPSAKRAFDILREHAERLKVIHVRVPFRWLKEKNLPATNVEPWTYSVKPRNDMLWAFAMRGIRGLDEFVLYQNWTGEESDNMEVMSAEAWFKEEMMKPKPEPKEG